MRRAAVLGGTGYGGMALLRLLLGHADVEVVAVTSRSTDGRVADVSPRLQGFTGLTSTRETEGALEALAGTAVQHSNLVSGLDEGAGLRQPALGP